MSYATVSDFRAWTAHLSDVLDDLDDDAVQGLLDRAAADLDGFLHWPPPLPDPLDEQPLPGPGRIRAELTPWETWCLRRANVAQAAYRLIVVEEDLAEGTPRVTAVPGGVTFAATAPDRLGPEALVAIAGVGVLWTYKSGTVAPEPEPLTWIDPLTGRTASMPPAPALYAAPQPLLIEPESPPDDAPLV